MVTLITSGPTLIADRNLEKNQIGFVPTMGNLHEGHISLLEKALENNETVYFSIFVNPKQFGPHEDFQKYPRTLSFDMAKIEECAKKFPHKKIVVFAPTDPQQVFPQDDEQTISVVNLGQIIEGKIRPGHFDGVASVVYQLFHLIKPHKAYFGLKDYQQYLVIRQMVKDLVLPIEIIGMPTVREKTGLALSSRNQYLSLEEKKQALTLAHGLKKVAQLIDGKKENLPKAKREIDLLRLDSNWNYFEMRDAETLSEELTLSGRITLLGVYQIGATRLIDNMQLEIE